MRKALYIITCIVILLCLIGLEICIIRLQDRMEATEKAVATVMDEVASNYIPIPENGVKGHQEPEKAIENEEKTEEIEISEEENEIVEEPEEVEPPRLYTDEDAAYLAMLIWGEAGGVPELKIGDKVVSSEAQQAAVVWTVLNRYDAGFKDSIIGVIMDPGQYDGYSELHPVSDKFMKLALDVLDRWNREKNGETDVGRVLPSDYMWFGGDGTYNYFRNEYEGGTRWTWDLADPYISIDCEDGSK